MPGKRPVGGGRRGGASGVEGSGVGNQRDRGADRRVDEGGSRRDRGADRRVVGGNRSAGRTHGTTGDIGSRRNGAGCGNSSGGGSSNMRSDGRGNRGFEGCWPAGCIGAKDVDRRFPRWWSRIRKMFFAYYDFDPKHGTKNDAREALNTHMRRNMRKTLCNERKRILKIIKERGGSFLEHRPRYYSEVVWKPICEHWESPKFEKKSDAAKEAREHQKIPHTSGAISFQRRAWDIRDKTGNEPKLYDLFLRWHTKDKENKEFTSQAVRIIVEQYLAKCREQNVDPSEAPIDTWVEVVGVRKNVIIGLPRTSAYEVIPLPPTSGKKRRRRSVDDESGASTGRSIIQHIADDLVMQAVDRTVAFARAHPHEFDLAPEQVNMLAQSVAEGASDLPSDHPLTMATMRELVQVMVSVLGDVYGSNRPTSNCKKGKSIARQDEHRSDDDDGGQSPRPGRSRSGDRNGIWIRGD